jgi:hypothetical protein
VELVNEVAPVGEDQDTSGLRGLDEPERRDRLARARGVLEPEALGRIGILRLLAERVLLVLIRPVARLLVGVALRLGVALLLGLVLVDRLELIVIVLVLVLVGSGTLDGPELLVVLVEVVVVLGLLLVLVLLLGIGVRDPCRSAVGLGAVGGHLVGTEDVGRGEQLRRGGGSDTTIAARDRALGLGQQRRERARESVYLVRRELGAVGELRLIVGEQALESQQQRELAPPGGRRVLGLGVGLELGERLIERAPAGAAGRERDGGILAGVHEALAHELLRSRDVGGTRNGHGRWGR